MHDKKVLVFGVDNIELNKICSLIECRLKGLEGVFRKDGAEPSMSDVKRATSLMNVRSRVWFAGDQ